MLTDIFGVSGRRLIGALLDGQNLDSATEVYLWPDRGVTSPKDIASLPVASASPGSVTVLSSELSGASLANGTHRISVRADTHIFTPYVVLELTP